MAVCHCPLFANRRPASSEFIQSSVEEELISSASWYSSAEFGGVVTVRALINHIQEELAIVSSSPRF